MPRAEAKTLPKGFYGLVPFVSYSSHQEVVRLDDYDSNEILFLVGNTLALRTV